MADAHTVILRSNRDTAHRIIAAAPMGSVMKVSPPKRTLDQNALLWALLTDVSVAKPEGRALTPEVWKALFCQALGHDQRFEMALDGKGFVPLGYRTSSMTKAQMSDLIETIYDYGARHGVAFKD